MTSARSTHDTMFKMVSRLRGDAALRRWKTLMAAVDIVMGGESLYKQHKLVSIATSNERSKCCCTRFHQLKMYTCLLCWACIRAFGLVYICRMGKGGPDLHKDGSKSLLFPGLQPHNQDTSPKARGKRCRNKTE